LAHQPHGFWYYVKRYKDDFFSSIKIFIFKKIHLLEKNIKEKKNKKKTSFKKNSLKKKFPYRYRDQCHIYLVITIAQSAIQSPKDQPNRDIARNINGCAVMAMGKFKLSRHNVKHNFIYTVYPTIYFRSFLH
jgi:hypothetical protein